MSKVEFVQPKTVEEAIKIGKELIKRSTANLEKLDMQWRENINVMLALIDFRPDAYQYASVAMRSDKKLAYKVIEKSPKMFKFVAGGLNNDINLFKLALEKSSNKSSLFEFISDELKDNKPFILSYISDYPMILEFVSDRLKDDDSIVKLATAKNPNALKHASMRFRDDKEFVLSLMYTDKTYTNEFGVVCKDTSSLYVIQHASNRLRSDPEIVNKTTKIDIFTYRCFSNKVRSNKKFAISILRREGILLDSVDESLKNDKEVVLTAVKNYGAALEYASEELKADRDVVLAAIKKDGRALTYASAELRKDIDLINVAFKTSGPFIIEPLAFKVYSRMELSYGISESTKQEIEFSVRNRMYAKLSLDLKDLELQFSKKAELIERMGYSEEEKAKKLESLEREKHTRIQKLKAEYGARSEKEIEDIVYEKELEKMKSDPNYSKISKYNSGEMTANEVLKFQAWLLKHATEADKTSELDSSWSTGGDSVD